MIPRRMIPLKGGHDLFTTDQLVLRIRNLKFSFFSEDLGHNIVVHSELINKIMIHIYYTNIYGHEKLWLKL